MSLAVIGMKYTSGYLLPIQTRLPVWECFDYVYEHTIPSIPLLRRLY